MPERQKEAKMNALKTTETDRIPQGEARHKVYLLWDDGMVILQNEPLNMMCPQPLLLHCLGLREKHRASAASHTAYAGKGPRMGQKAQGTWKELNQISTSHH